MLTPLDLPPLTREESAHSARLVARIRAALDAAGGWLPFARYMELALYAPGLGYYSAGARKFGRDGDFVTAPELSPAFGRAIGTQVADVLRAVDGDTVMELGAGTGALAAELLGELEREGCAPRRYLIVDVSADLRDRQRERLAQLPPALASCVAWLDAPPAESFRGAIVANEVLDALPVERFRRAADGVRRLGVAWRDGAFVAEAGDAAAHAAEVARADVAETASLAHADAALADAITAIEAERGGSLPIGYESDVCVALPAWLAHVTSPLAAGVALFVDYGESRADYYADERDGGTLVAHYRHRRVDDPYARVGLQDLTAWVDFTHAAEAGLAAGFEVAGYTTQAHFLLACGFDRHVAALVAARPAGEGALLAHAAARLVLPGEMGERFKVLALARGIDAPLRGFALRDFTATL
jgi:SAM-dependent MidA family methyltransferase